jgi:hypothetical protein
MYATVQLKKTFSIAFEQKTSPVVKTPQGKAG